MTNASLDKYKDSGIKWIGEIPQEWNLKKAKHIFVQSFEKGGEDLTLLSATQNEGVIPKDGLEGVVQVKEDTDLSLFKTVKKKDFVISLRSFQGGFEYSNFNGVITPAYTVFRNKIPINDDYFKMLFKSDGFIAKINSLTTGIREGKNIQYDDFKHMTLPLPTLDEQQQIADYLDKKCGEVDRVVEVQKQIIEKLKEYKQSVITEAVTKGLDKNAPLKDSGIEWIGKIPYHWKTIRIKNVAWLKGRIGWQGLKSNEYQETGAYLITGTDFDNGKINWDSCVHITQERYNEDADIHIKENDLLITKDGTVGKVALALNCPPNVSLNSGVLLIRNTKNIKYFSKYLFYIILSDVFWQWFSSNLNGNSTIIHLYQEQFYNFCFCFPDPEEQKQIADYLDIKCAEIDKAISEKEALIEKLTEYKKSLIYECVTGKRRVAV